MIRVTADGWSVVVTGVGWPEEQVILEPPGSDVMRVDRAAGCALIARPISEIRCVGFSPSGMTLALVTASEVAIYQR